MITSDELLDRYASFELLIVMFHCPTVKLYVDITNVLFVQAVLTEQTNTSRVLNAGPVHRSQLP